MKFAFSIALALLSAGCENRPYNDNIAGYDALVEHIKAHRVGRNADQWIEMKNVFGEWERTGLIFAYSDDYEECLKAIAGLKKANADREYRCTSAN